MQIQVDLPAAWFLLPLASDVVRDPDLDDDPPRYNAQPTGGWQAIGDAVLGIYDQFQQVVDDPFTQSLSLDIDVKLTRDQEWIVGTWFCVSEAPQLEVDADSWINGRHRTWGMKVAGFEFAPALLTPIGDAIHSWEPDPLEWHPFDASALANQYAALARWGRSPWAAPNRLIEARWNVVLYRWDERLAGSA